MIDSRSIMVKRIGEHTWPVPTRGTEGAAGFDLVYVGEDHEFVFPGDFVLVPTGFAWAIPVGWVGLIRDRSGHAWKHKLTTRAGVIDPDYRGEVKVMLTNDYKEGPAYAIEPGERIAQMVVVRNNPAIHALEVDTLPETKRGDGGFGSTGKLAIPALEQLG